MNKNEAQNTDIEPLLRSLPLKPAPPGLRERVLKPAKAEREARAWTTPLLRACLAACAGLLMLIFALDAVATRSQTVRLQALLGATRTTQSEAGREWASLDKDLGDSLTPDELAREKRILAFRQKAYPVPAGRYSREFDREVFDGHELSENLN
jgi:hypothetical protein